MQIRGQYTVSCNTNEKHKTKKPANMHRGAYKRGLQSDTTDQERLNQTQERKFRDARNLDSLREYGS